MLKPSETRASQISDTVRVDQHTPCYTGNQRTRLTDTPRAGDPCWAETTNTVRAADPCGTTFSLARSVQLTRVRKVGFARLTCTVRVEDPCCSFPSASWSSAHSWTQLFTQNSTVTSPKPNHFKITPTLPQILLEGSPKPWLTLNQPHSQLTAWFPTQISNPHFQSPLITTPKLKSYSFEASIGQGKEMIKKGLHWWWRFSCCVEWNHSKKEKLGFL